ncbi:MAG: phosphoribosylanthranilate isomerase [Clostridiales bacterium]|jgi:phosphoribosylanthranilate isomerase|nr:phosphoribosylanthranilate isomerase [Clostridiales bacterium]
MKPLLKICGLMQPEDVRHCLDIGVDILGFVTEYPLAVPWNLKREQTAALIDQVRRSADGQTKSCIVTGGSPEFVIELATELKPDLIQLHYRESFEDTKVIANKLKGLGIGIIKTIPISSDARLEQFGTSDLLAVVELLNSIDIYAILIDSRGPENASQTGRMLDTEFCRQVIQAAQKPVIIAGGIRPENVIEVIEKTGAKIIDIMTGVETSPGVKSFELLDQVAVLIEK